MVLTLLPTNKKANLTRPSSSVCRTSAWRSSYGKIISKIDPQLEQHRRFESLPHVHCTRGILPSTDNATNLITIVGKHRMTRSSYTLVAPTVSGSRFWAADVSKVCMSTLHNFRCVHACLHGSEHQRLALRRPNQRANRCGKWTSAARVLASLSRLRIRSLGRFARSN